MKVKWPILIVGLGGTAALIALLATGFSANINTAVTDVITGKQAPAFELVDLQGRTWSVEELEGKPVFINFWSTWCGPCKMEHPMLLQAAKAYPDVQFLGIIYNDAAAAVDVQLRRPPYNRLMSELESAAIEYPNLSDPDGRTALRYGVVGVPESFFVDRTGLVTYKQVGPLNADTAKRELARIRKQ
ncbi:MAG TPA: TlpA family protein disulfide reductase [Deltaproteobacteria bacterium]|nr:TlpA family protein disulfide reductase [Deltaproteobacteria bacterium]